MFDLLFNSMMAYDQILKLVAGICCSGIGALVIGYMCYLRRRDRLYDVEIAAVKKSDAGARPMFCAELVYVDEVGKQHRALANSSSSSIGGLVLGRKMKGLVDPDSAEDIMLLSDWWLVTIVGVVFFVFGLPFIVSAVKHLVLNPVTFAVATAVSGTLGLKLYKKIHPLLDTRNAGGWKEKLKAFRKEKLNANAESFQPLDADEITEYSAAQSKQMTRALPVLIVIGIGLFAGGAAWERSRLTFIANAAAAEGRVIRNEISTNDSHAMYHAVVEFVDANRQNVIYRDDIGANPPSFTVGDSVHVFYTPNDSQHAMIDRGFWNWLVPAVLCAVGLLVAFSSLRGLIANRRFSNSAS